MGAGRTLFKEPYTAVQVGKKDCEGLSDLHKYILQKPTLSVRRFGMIFIILKRLSGRPIGHNGCMSIML